MMNICMNQEIQQALLRNERDYAAVLLDMGFSRHTNDTKERIEAAKDVEFLDADR